MRRNVKGKESNVERIRRVAFIERENLGGN